MHWLFRVSTDCASRACPDGKDALAPVTERDIKRGRQVVLDAFVVNIEKSGRAQTFELRDPAAATVGIYRTPGGVYVLGISVQVIVGTQLVSDGERDPQYEPHDAHARWGDGHAGVADSRPGQDKLAHRSEDDPFGSSHCSRECNNKRFAHY